MGRFLDIADRALREMGQGSIKPVRPSKIHNEINEVNELSTNCLRGLAGDEWPEISADPDQLAAFKAAAETAARVQRGIVPVHYTATTEYRRCGPVPIFPGVPDYVEGCPWCFNRAAGRPVPQAHR